jgi:type VI secretion system secreted protein VgrG
VKETFNTTQTTVVAKEIDISSTSSSIHLTSPTEILLTVKGSFVKITPDAITLSAKNIHFEGGTQVTGKAPLVKFEGTDKFEALAPKVTVDGKTEAVFQSSAGKTDLTAATKATLGVSGQTVVCDPAAVAISGAMVKSAATGVHEITGALVKIN